MQIQTWLIQQEHSVLRLASGRVSRERNVESEEPLKTSAPVVEVNLNIVGARRVRDDRIKVVRVQVETNLECAILPKPFDFGTDNCASAIRELISCLEIVLPV